MSGNQTSRRTEGSHGANCGQVVGDKTYLNPTAGATRAELATILMNFKKSILEK